MADKLDFVENWFEKAELMAARGEIIFSLWKARFGIPNRGDFGVLCTSAMRSTGIETENCATV